MRRHETKAHLRRAIPLTILAALFLAACGPSPSITVQVGDATIQIIVGSSATTEVALTRAGGASADVTLDASGAPDWVSVSFAPAVSGPAGYSRACGTGTKRSRRGTARSWSGSWICSSRAGTRRMARRSRSRRFAEGRR